ncbi:hypothetical protein J6590_026722 [Homalodisca vitripennis]|nr:hypothetical protein J6590_026722 [Homalodisca vitripennis]
MPTGDWVKIDQSGGWSQEVFEVPPEQPHRHAIGVTGFFRSQIPLDTGHLHLTHRNKNEIGLVNGSSRGLSENESSGSATAKRRTAQRGEARNSAARSMICGPSESSCPYWTFTRVKTAVILPVLDTDKSMTAQHGKARNVAALSMTCGPSESSCPYWTLTRVRQQGAARRGTALHDLRFAVRVSHLHSVARRGTALHDLRFAVRVSHLHSAARRGRALHGLRFAVRVSHLARIGH